MRGALTDVGGLGRARMCAEKTHHPGGDFLAQKSSGVLCETANLVAQVVAVKSKPGKSRDLRPRHGSGTRRDPTRGASSGSPLGEWRGNREIWSGKRDSNPRPSAWKADALAAELFPHMDLHLDDDGGGGRIRTFEGVSRQIYSLLPLAARAPLHADSRAQGAARDAAALVLAGGATSRLPPPAGGGTAELAKGLEPPTTSLQMRCSTIELRQQIARK